MKEIAPGIHHWTNVHPRIEQPVSSYWLEPAGTLLDPLFADGASPPGGARQVVLTNRLHRRSAPGLGLPVRVPQEGMHAFEDADFEVRAYAAGEELAPGIEAIEIGGICPDECALHVAHGGGALAIADGVIRRGDGPLMFVPDSLMDDPETVKATLLDAYRALLERDFDHLLLAHGDPWVGGGKAALRKFLDSV